MRFPLDVQKNAVNAGKVAGSDKIKLYIFGSLLLYGGSNFVAIPFFESIGVPWYIPFLVITALGLCVFVLVFRFFIVKEDEKKREFDNQASDSFAKFYSFRNISSGDTIKSGKLSIPIFEYENGSNVIILRLRYGSNDNAKYANTKKAFESIFKLIGSMGLDFNYICDTEDFEGSPEYIRYLRKLRRIKDKSLAKRVLDIADIALNEAESKSNVEISTIMIKTRSNYQKYEFDFVVRNIMKLLVENKTCFRAAYFAERDEVLEVIQDFYGLGAIDLALMRVKNKEDLDKDYQYFVEVYKLESTTGVKLTNPEVLSKAVTVGRKVN